MRSDTDSDDSEGDSDMVDDDNDSGSSDESGSVESEEEAPKSSRRKAAVPKKKATPKKNAAAPASRARAVTPKSNSRKRKIESSESEDEEEDDEATGNQNEVKVLKQVQNRTLKEQLIADILCRWWYVLPEWPPANFDFGAALEKAGLRLVTLERWEDEPDEDKAGRVKCYALTQFKGLYRDAKGLMQDLRPKEGKPCFSNLVSKGEKELQSLLCEALKRQIEVLSASNEKSAPQLIADLRGKLKTVGLGVSKK